MDSLVFCDVIFNSGHVVFGAPSKEIIQDAGDEYFNYQIDCVQDILAGNSNINDNSDDDDDDDSYGDSYDDLRGGEINCYLKQIKNGQWYIHITYACDVGNVVCYMK